jgi:1-acyl-sn-glycerol-3-phosphate acyltransferase
MHSPQELLDNPDTYQRFIDHGGPSPRVMRAFHAISSELFLPRTVYMDGSHEAIAEHLGNGKQAVFALGHSSWADIPVIGAVMGQDEAYDNAIGTIVTPAKAKLFKNPAAAKLLTAMGAVTTHRREDVFGKDNEVGDEDMERRWRQAATQMLGVCTDHLNNGHHVAGFWEGTRNRGDRTQIQKIKSGVVRIINGAENPADLMVVFMSPYYGERKLFKSFMSPTVGIGHLAVGEVGRVTKPMIQQTQQATLDLAVEAYNYVDPEFFEVR